MKIHVEEHYGEFWAYDDDTYDGAPDAHCPVGVGLTDYSAINDLMEQVIDEIEERLENARFERDCLKAENKAFRDAYPQTPPVTLREDPRQRVFPWGSATLTLPEDCEVTARLPEDGCQGRLPDEPAHWDSGYDAKEYDRDG
jgi:hypothetical protein